MARKTITLPAPAKIKATGREVEALRYKRVAGIACVTVKDTDGQERDYGLDALTIFGGRR